MNKVISFGDSFTEGLGVDRKYEESLLGGHPNWDTMTDEEKNIQRSKVGTFRHENSYTAGFAKKLGMGYLNKGLQGCSNVDIMNTILTYDSKLQQGDIVLIGYTSSLRSPLPFFPKLFTGSSIPNKSVLHLYKKKIKSVDNLENFFQDYYSFYLTEMFDNKYYELFNYNLIVFLQKYLEYKKVKYIMIDAFDYMVNEKYEHIDTKYYWNFNKKTILSYVKSFNDEGLLEQVGYNVKEQPPRHPSIEGHKIFAEELYKFYNKVYNG